MTFCWVSLFLWIGFACCWVAVLIFLEFWGFGRWAVCVFHLCLNFPLLFFCVSRAYFCQHSLGKNDHCPETGGQRVLDWGFPALHRHHSGTGRKDTHNVNVVGKKEDTHIQGRGYTPQPAGPSKKGPANCIVLFCSVLYCLVLNCIVSYWIVLHLKGYAFCRRPLLGPRGCYLGVWCLHFSTLGDHFGTSGAPWRTMGAAAGWTRGDPEQDFHRFGIDFGTVFWKHFGHWGLKFQFISRACFQVTFCIDFDSKFGRRSS